MKLRLIGINEEVTYENLPASAEPQIQSPSGRITMARFEIVNTPSPTSYTAIVVPYRIIEGAQIGDEFTFHLERVKK